MRSERKLSNQEIPGSNPGQDFQSPVGPMVRRLTTGLCVVGWSSQDGDHEIDSTAETAFTGNFAGSVTTNTVTTTTTATFAAWRGYRLGDWVLHNGKGSKFFSQTKEPWFNDSIAHEYLVELDAKSNGTLVGDQPVRHPLAYDKDVFCNIVKRRGEITNAKISLTGATRPGDVVLPSPSVG